MKSTTREGPVSGGAFTLIELLIVVAIIAILAAIAVPNFLEAQARAKVSRAMTDMRTVHVAINAYEVDYNTCLRDFNDTDWPSWLRSQMGFVQENPGVTTDLIFLGATPPTAGSWMPRFYSFLAFRPLTTPVAFLSNPKLLDTWSRVVPLGMDTREEPRGCIAYWVLLCAGPDRDEGDWYRGNNPSGKAVKYDPTNGTVSGGDIWRGEAYMNQSLYYKEYTYPL